MNPDSLRPWRSFVLPLLLTVMAVFGAFGFPRFPLWSQLTLFAVFATGLLFFFISTVVWTVRKRWHAGAMAFGGLLLGSGSLLPAAAIGFSRSFGSEIAGSDDFAFNLVLPEGVNLQDPATFRFQADTAGPAGWDVLQRAQRLALETPGTSDATITPSLRALGTLQRDHPALLRQYLAAHPGWWYHDHRGSPYATRRWKEHGQWQHRLHGYYSSFSTFEGMDRYQTRICLGLSGKKWSRGATEMQPGLPAPAPLSQGNRLFESYICWKEDALLVEMFEQAETEERRMTKAALRELDKEFTALLASPTWEHARTFLPKEAITRGTPSFAISGQGGIYRSRIRVNPGEPGRVYLKAFEITGNTPLSADAIKTRTCEYIGWSPDPMEQFLASAEFTIYEGEWEQYYGARLEVWFEPTGKGPPRKLMESNWKVEGWTR